MNLKFMHSIESLRHVCQWMASHCDYHGKEVKPVIRFRGTVKLHGTSGAVNIKGTTATAMGRNRALTINDDSFGFAHYVAGREDTFRMLAAIATKSLSDEVTIYGEWCGQGIQKKVAVSTLPKMFVVFAIFNHTTDSWVDIHEVKLTPEERGHLNSLNIHLITEAPSFEVEIDFNDPVPAAELISKFTLQVEDCCPFAVTHGVNGIGEGLVWVSEGWEHRLVFKSKGEKHKKSDGTRHQVAVDPEKVASISALVDLLLPEWRLEQGISYLIENKIPLANTSTGPYLKWVAQDILKEESDRIAANPYPWKDIQGTVMNRARDYFINHLNELAGLGAVAEVDA